MRKYLVSLAFVSCLAAVASPAAAAPAPDDTAASGAVAVQRSRVPVAGLHDQAAMVLVGTALIGLAAAVRRTA